MNTKEQWRNDIEKHIQHFDRKVAVCSCLAYCDCSKHETIAILFVETEYKNAFELPGGRRDMAGTGRASFRKTDETCWNTMVSEFDEEVNEKLTDFEQEPCEFFHCKTARRQTVRVYYLKIDCESIPNKDYGRLRLFETVSRRWVSLEDLIFSLVSSKKKEDIIQLLNGKEKKLEPYLEKNLVLMANLKKTLKIFGIIIRKIFEEQKTIDDEWELKKYRIEELFELIGSTDNNRICEQAGEIEVDIELDLEDIKPIDEGESN